MAFATVNAALNVQSSPTHSPLKINMPIYFISDLHLQESHPAMTQGFFHFLENLKDAEALYILGDFFEVWIGDDYETPFIKSVKDALAALSARGVKLYLLHGNRDFALGELFCAQTGAEILPDPCVVKVQDTQVLLMHGDSLCTADLAYMKMRPMLRNPMMIKQLLSQSIENRLAMAARMRGESQKGNAMKAAEIMDVTPEEVDKVLSEKAVAVMIHGHTHRPFDHHWQHEGQARRRLVLGDWSDTQGWMIRAENNQFELKSFSL